MRMNFAILRLMQPERIAALLAPYLGGATLTDAQLSQLATFLDLLIRWNARINLTSVRQPEQIVSRHFGESPGRQSNSTLKIWDARPLFPRRC